MYTVTPVVKKYASVIGSGVVVFFVSSIFTGFITSLVLGGVASGVAYGSYVLYNKTVTL